MAALDALVAVSPWSEANLARYCTAAGHRALVVQLEDGEVCGFLIYSRVLDEASIDNVAVHPHSQGAGMGGRLLRAALAEMIDAGLQRCLLEVRQSNVAALALYRNNGFTVDGVRPAYYVTDQGREDALLMSRRL